MPTTINGIGTWYWGKRNIVTRNDACEFCSNYGQLNSYDTTLYFVVFFVPIIPMGRKRIIDECPRCKKHRAIALRKWEEQKTKSLMAAIEAWQADRNNAEKAATAIGITIGYHDRQAFDDIAPAVGQQFARDPKVQLFLGEANEHFAHPEAAEQCYQAAQALLDDAPTRREVAKYFLRTLRPDEARPLLADILTTKDASGTGVLLGLAQAYQAVGNHDAAAKLMDDVGTAFPNLLSDAEYDRIRRVSSKYQGTSKRIKVAGLDPATRGGVREANWMQRHGAKAIIATILVIAAVWYLAVAAGLSHHKVHVVNGTTVSYVAKIDGTPRSVPAKGFVSIDLDEGKHTVSVQDHPEIQQQTIEMRTNFWNRPFDRRTFVINPDRTAFIYEDTAVYGPAAGDVPAPSAYVGSVMYNLKKADDEFVEPPSSVSTPSKGSTIKRRHLDQITKVAPEQMPLLIKEKFGAAEANEWLKRSLVIGGDNLSLLGLLTLELSPPEMIVFLREHLNDKPIRINWHRIYQQMMEKHRPEYDLVKDYRAMLEKDPADGTLIYLVARILPDRKEQKAMFAKAAEAQPPCAFALYALSHDDLVEVRFDQSLERIRKARQLDPKNELFIRAEGESLEAVGRWDEALELVRAQQKHDGRDHAEVSTEVRLLVSKGDPAAAQERIELYCKELDGITQHDQETVTLARTWLNSTYAYARGDMPAFTAALKEVKGPNGAWQTAIVEGKYDAAETALKELKGAGTEQYLTIAALAGGGGNQAAADRAWAKAKELLQAGAQADRKLGAALAAWNGAAAPPVDAVSEWSATPGERCLMLICLGQRSPQQKESLFASAAKLNFSTEFPHRQISQVLGKAPGAK